jgi:hypothetical protein
VGRIQEIQKLTLEFNFQPSKTREVGEVTMKVTTKLAGPKPVTGNFFLSNYLF